jgi:hypothetical protein
MRLEARASGRGFKNGRKFNFAGGTIDGGRSIPGRIDQLLRPASLWFGSAAMRGGVHVSMKEELETIVGAGNARDDKKTLANYVFDLSRLCDACRPWNGERGWMSTIEPRYERCRGTEGFHSQPWAPVPLPRQERTADRGGARHGTLRTGTEGPSEAVPNQEWYRAGKGDVRGPEESLPEGILPLVPRLGG